MLQDVVIYVCWHSKNGHLLRFVSSPWLGAQVNTDMRFMYICSVMLIPSACHPACSPTFNMGKCCKNTVDWQAQRSPAEADPETKGPLVHPSWSMSCRSCWFPQLPETLTDVQASACKVLLRLYTSYEPVSPVPHIVVSTVIETIVISITLSQGYHHIWKQWGTGL